jgi:hypothetical protein
MKVYLLDVAGRGPRYFTDEKALITYLNNDDNRGDAIHRYKVTVLDAKVLEESNAKDYLDTYRKSTSEKNVREAKLSAVLGDEFAISFDKLITYITEFAKDSYVKQRFLEEIKLIPVEKKQISKFITKRSGYLLYEVSSTVEYYKLLLAVHNFRTIEDRYYALRYDHKGKEFVEGGFTKPINKKNFLKAKMG